MTDLRTAVEERLDSLADDPEKLERLWTLIDRACGQTKGEWKVVDCKHCGRTGKYFIEMPVVQASIRAFKDLMEMTKGKVPEQVNVDVRHWQALDMSEWPTEALQAVADREVVDGEFEEIPALPPASTD